MSWTRTNYRIALAKKKDRHSQIEAERLAAYIDKVVDAAPPLTPAQRDLVAMLLRGGPAHRY